VLHRLPIFGEHPASAAEAAPTSAA
jgi:hypothetical protein